MSISHNSAFRPVCCARLRGVFEDGCELGLTSSSSITNSNTLAISTESLCPVITSSQTRSVSRPDHPALLVMPSGGVRLDMVKGLLTTAICANVWEAISSSLARTSGFKEGLEFGVSRISERVTLMVARACGFEISKDW